MDLRIATKPSQLLPFPSPEPSECRCPGATMGFCGSLRRATALPAPRPQTTRPLRNIYVAGQRLDGVSVICEGWAARYVQLPDGRRQILSVLLPGDPITPAALFKDALDFSVQALTEVQICHYDRSRIRAQMAQDPALFDAVVTQFAAEREQADRLLTDLGQRPADERMARFFLQLLHRLKARGLAQGETFACPLRQRHIADAMGLTAVHVNRVMGHFRRSRLMDVTDGMVTIHSLADLRQVASVK